MSKTDFKTPPETRQSATPRTLQTMQQDYEKFMKAGGRRELSKDVSNSVVEKPILPIPINYVSGFQTLILSIIISGIYIVPKHEQSTFESVLKVQLHYNLSCNSVEGKWNFKIFLCSVCVHLCLCIISVLNFARITLAENHSHRVCFRRVILHFHISALQ